MGRIGIDVTVTDAQGHPVTGLEDADFKLLDEGQPVSLVSFAASSADGPPPGEPPVSVILVLDDADLPPADRTEAHADVEAFVRSNGGRLKQTVTVYRLTGDKLYATIPFDLDGNALADVIASGIGMREVWKKPIVHIERGPAGQVELAYNAATGLTAFQPPNFPDALKALGAITIEQRRLPGRKLLFWIGPGWRIDRQSKGLLDTITEFSTRLREARIELSVVNRWFGRETGRSMLSDAEIRRYVEGVHLEQTPYYNLALQVLAQRTGGGTLTTSDDLIAAAQPDRNNVPRLIAEHIAAAREYYRLTFDPPHTSTLDEYHRLSLEMVRPGLTPHTTAGYFDEPVFYDQPTTAAQETVAQLEEVLSQKQSDRKLADELAGLQLTERFSTPRLEQWLKRMPGQRSRQALTVLADASAFLPPPSDEILSQPAPDHAAQEAMFARVADFLVREVPRLPNFYAERTTVQFGEPPPQFGQTWKTAQPDHSLAYERDTVERIYFEDGKETTERSKLKVKQTTQEDLLETSGTFGPILVLAIKSMAAPGGRVIWSRWEKGPDGPIAVYRYFTAPDMRLYGVGFCCMAIDEERVTFHRMVPFRGELSVDPETGHILRLTVEADLDPLLPLKNSAIMVEYGAVEMGGKSYSCPLRSVSISRQRRLWELNESGMKFKTYGPFKTVLNDVTFDRYHLFRSESTILPGFVPVPQ